jgi:two-component system osmolarity sensor histidine kinase EnvZ
VKANRLVISRHGRLLGQFEPTELPRLVDRFFRGQNRYPAAPHSEGSGLGLAIVQRIAELHGARLELYNLAQGGLEARLRWP